MRSIYLRATLGQVLLNIVFIPCIQIQKLDASSIYQAITNTCIHYLVLTLTLQLTKNEPHGLCYTAGRGGGFT